MSDVTIPDEELAEPEVDDTELMIATDEVDEAVLPRGEYVIVLRKFDAVGAVRMPGELLECSGWPQSRVSQLTESRYVRPYPDGSSLIQDVHGRMYASPEAKLAAADHPEYGPVGASEVEPPVEDTYTDKHEDPNFLDSPVPAPDFDPNAVPNVVVTDSGAPLPEDDGTGDEEFDAEGYNPSEHSVKDVLEYIGANDINGDELVALRDAERAQKGRQTLLDPLNSMIASEADDEEDEPED